MEPKLNEIADNLCASIGYPEDERHTDGPAVVLTIDGAPLRMELSGDRLIFSRVLYDLSSGDKDVVAHLAAYATGRIFKEDATLAYDETRNLILLWQAAPAKSSVADIRGILEIFLASCDWWTSRLSEEVAASSPSSSLSSFIIRP